ncbi:hydrogenase maturation nickel metallochaperone HypA [Atopobiaceae bacterium 24-176]
MHELGIVFYIADEVKGVALANGATSVASVTVELGEVSGVVPRLLQDAWRWCADREELLRGSRLVMEEEPAVTLCEECGCRYATVAHGKVCPECGSPRTHLESGSDVLIREIAVV